MKKLSHFNSEGNVHMVNVSEKKETNRQAVASGKIVMNESSIQEIIRGSSKKGNIIEVARIAAIQACKRTSDLIPLCHPIQISSVKVDFSIDKSNHSVLCKSCVESFGKTGVEMEALTSVHIGLLTIYDMLKAVDRGMVVTEIKLEKKTGGKSGKWEI